MNGGETMERQRNYYRELSESFDANLREELARPKTVRTLEDLTRAIAGPLMYTPPDPSQDR